ncbi:MAG: 1-acyl-sn-glycerol-3-phosphate acyltransferase, partial [Myxococcales bacterium]|nr:1-acyl-sn-glycerol-3-phosphate acyltransferase [Myxococcales bacterium]
SPPIAAIRAALRRAGVGGSLLLFGAGSAWLSFAYLPLLLRDRRPEEARARAQRAIRGGFRFFLGTLRALRSVDFHPDAAQAEEPLPEGSFVLVANHPTIIDVIALTASHPQLVCAVKGKFFALPMLRPLLEAAGYLNSGAEGASDLEALIEQAVERLEEGCPVLVFAEGTRSPPGGLHAFRRAPFEIAARAGVPIVPVVIHVEEPFMARGLPWYRFPDRFVRYHVERLPTLPSEAGRRATRAARGAVEASVRARLGLGVTASAPRRPHPSIQPPEDP